MAKRRYRRRARRLRRFRRSRRSSFRRRYSRSRRSFRRWRRRGRFYYRRKGFYQRRGYKLAVTRFKATGSFTRTYKFYCNPFLIMNNNGDHIKFDWNGQGNPPAWTDAYVPSNFTIWSYSSLSALAVNSGSPQSKQFTGPCNMYGVVDLPMDMRRALGYSQYTVINLSQVGVFWLEWVYDYINQRDLIRQDCEKYGYYRALSVSVKFVPRYASVPGKVSSMVPTGFTYTPPDYTTTLATHTLALVPQAKVTDVIGTYTGASAGANSGLWAVNPTPIAPQLNGIITIPAYKNEDPITVNAAPATSPVTVTTSGVAASSAWDDDALTLIGYLIPSGPDLDDGVTQANFPGWVSSTFGRVVTQPDVQWCTAFRKGGYPRSYISKNKPTTFKFILPQGAVCGQLNIPIGAVDAQQLYGFYKTQGDNARSPFTGHKECVKPGLMTAELVELDARTNSTQGNTDVRNMKFWKYFNPANCNLFIPGVTPQMLLNRYKISFSYKVQYYSRVYDMN